MLEVVEQGLRNFGRPPKLGRADQLLLTLMYWREYRTEFHIGLAYGISESAVCRTIKKIENALIKSEQFHLPNLMCNSFESIYTAIKPSKSSGGRIKEDTNSVRQNFTNQTVLKMPKVVYTNLVYFETSCQMGAYCFDTFSDTSIEFKKRIRKLSFHIIPLRSNNKNFVMLQQERSLYASMNPFSAGAIPSNPSSKVSIL
ncbi:hypothetical protein LDFHOB_13660 [Candidatus Electronema aureum]